MSPEIIFKIDPLIILVTSISERIILPGVLFSFVMLVLTLVLGRFFCGWVCPLGTFSDWMGSLKKKKFVPKDAANTDIRKIKFAIFTIIGFFALAGIQLAWVFDPMVIMARFVSLNLIPAVTWAVDKMFIELIQGFRLYNTPVYDFYRILKSSILGVHVAYFSNALVIFIFFLSIVLAGFIVLRLWCRMLCPLGALYCLMAKPAMLERVVDEQCVACGLCRSDCRMGAIRKDVSYAKGECILCMDCVYDCPKDATRFRWWFFKKKAKTDPIKKNGLTRRNFIFLFASSFFIAAFRRKRMFREARAGSFVPGVIRPPGALKEDAFLDRCIRCGNCMKVCITNGLQPVMLESGLEGMWTPQLVPEIGYCEYHCTLCGNVCPTGAIPKLTQNVKQKTKLGTAFINRSACVAWAKDEDCIVCQEHCPISEKAIKLQKVAVAGRIILKPHVDRELCVGCGICQNVCPVDLIKAIRVSPVGSHRT